MASIGRDLAEVGCVDFLLIPWIGRTVDVETSYV